MLLGVVVAVVAVLALRSPHHGSSSADNSKNNHPTTHAPSVSPSPSTTPSASASSSSAPVTSTVSVSAGGNAKSVPLVVLNNTTITGLADQAAVSFRAGGWTVTSVGNYQNNILSTCAYYDPSVSGAQAAAQALQQQFPGIKRVEPKFSGLVAGPIVVVLTSADYAS